MMKRPGQRTLILSTLVLLLILACRLPGGGSDIAEPAETVVAGDDAGASGEASSSDSSAAESESSEVPMPQQRLDRYVIDQAKHPKALCNDGTTPVFYYRPGVGSGTNNWVIWFKGGGTGYSRETMRTRHISVTSSDQWMTAEYSTLGSGGNQNSADGEAGGIMSALPEENPDFYNWNVAYLVYCSSDGWTGTREASEQSGNMHFAGHYIVDAMIDALKTEAIVGTQNLNSAERVIFSGSSAGAQGLRSNLDRLAAMLDFADVRGISDAGVFLFGIPEFEAIFDATTQEQHQVWQAELDESCVADYPSEAWRCLSGGFLVANGYVETPMFIHQDQEDIKLQEAFTATGFDLETYLPRVGEATRPLLEEQDGVYSPIQGRHIILNSNRFARFRFDGHTMAGIFGNWYFDREGPTTVIQYP